MHLFTVTIVFEDRTFAIEQVESNTAQHALKAACKQAEALADRDARAIAEMIQHHSKLFQVATLRGVWNWFPVPHESDDTADIFGGTIVQTDRYSPIRE
jgi:hypothetical protein